MAEPIAVGTLPAWIAFAPPLLVGIGAAGGAAGLTALAVGWDARPFDRLPADAHWTERARALWTARRSAGVALLLVLVVVGLWSVVAWDRWATIAAPGSLGALFGASVGQRGLRRRLGWAPVGAWETVRRAVGFRLAMHGHLWGTILVVFLLPHGTVRAAVGAVLAVLGIGVVGYSGLMLDIGRRLGLVDPPPERLARVVGEVAAAAGIEAPKTFVVPAALANAAAYPPGGRLFFTSRAVAELDDDGLRAVAAHEIGHLTEPLAVQLARASGLVLLVLLVLLPTALVAGRRGMVLLGIAMMGASVLVLVVRRIARRMEERADEHAHDHPAYAAALERIYALNLIPAVLREKRVHPDLYDRLVSAGAPPPWPRPAPPRRFSATVLAGGILLGACVFAGAFAYAVGSALAPRPALYASLALGVRSAVAFGVLAEDRVESGDLPTALAAWRAAAEEQPWNPAWPEREALARAQAGDCQGAVGALRRASGLRIAVDPDDEDATLGGDPAVVDAVRRCFDASGG